MNILKNNIVISSIIISLGLIIGVTIMGKYLYSIRGLDDSISVSGSTKEKVTSDNGKLVIKIEKEVSSQNISSGYANVQNQSKDISAQIAAKGVTSKDIIISALSSYEQYQQNGGEKKYLVSQTVTASSSDVNLLDALSKELPLQTSAQGIVSVQSLEFYYSKLADLRVSLIQKAIEDAKKRAESLTEATGVKIKKLKSASTGIVQVVPVNSTDISDYGTYDTSTIEKEVIVTVKAAFVKK